MLLPLPSLIKYLWPPVVVGPVVVDLEVGVHHPFRVVAGVLPFRVVAGVLPFRVVVGVHPFRVVVVDLPALLVVVVGLLALLVAVVGPLMLYVVVAAPLLCATSWNRVFFLFCSSGTWEVLRGKPSSAVRVRPS